MQALARIWPPSRQSAVRVLLIIAVLLAAQITSCSHPTNTKSTGGIQAVSRQHTSRARLPSQPADSDTQNSGTQDSGTQNSGTQNSDTQNSGTQNSGAAQISPPGTQEPSFSDSPEFQIVQQLLSRYSKAVTELAAQPELSLDPLSPSRVLFDALITPQNSLSIDVINQLVLTPVEQRSRVLPDATGLSYSYRPIQVGSAVDASISFSWCGYSPGIRVAQGTEEVLDDAVAQFNGTGSVRLSGKDWLIDSMDHLDLKLLPAGSSDPCPPPKITETPK